MEWCGSDSTLSDQGGPSECLCFAVIVPIPSFLIALFILFRYTCMETSPPSTHDNNRSKQVLRVILVCSFTHLVLFMAISFSENITPAKISAVILELIAWFASGFSIYYDYTTDREWPSTSVNAYFLCDVFVSSIVAATVYSEDRLTATFVLGILLFLVAMCTSIVSIFKYSIAGNIYDDDKYYGRSDEEDERASFFGNMGLKIFGRSSLGGDASSSLNPQKPLLSPTNSVDSDGNKYEILGIDDRDSFGSGGPVGRHFSRWSVASEEVSLVKSALDVRLSDVERGARTSSAVGYYTSSPRKGTAGHLSCSVEDGDGRTGIVTSGALARVLEQPQSARAAHALSSSSTGLTGALAPGGVTGMARRPSRRRGGTTRGEFSAATRRDVGGSGEGPGGGHGRAARMSSGTNPLDTLHVLVEKWGLRRPGCGHEDVGRGEGARGSGECPMSFSAHKSGGDDEDHHPRRLESFARLDSKGQEQREAFLRSMLKKSDGKALSSMTEGVEGEEDEGSGEDEAKLLLPMRLSSPGLEDWTRQQESTPHHRGSSRPIVSSSLSGGDPAADLSSRISLLDPSGSSQDMELEFEISLNMMDDEDEPFPSLGGGWGGRSGRKGEGDGDGGKDSKWAVWRTGKELLSLHAVLVSEPPSHVWQ